MAKSRKTFPSKHPFHNSPLSPEKSHLKERIRIVSVCARVSTHAYGYQATTFNKINDPPGIQAQPAQVVCRSAFIFINKDLVSVALSSSVACESRVTRSPCHHFWYLIRSGKFNTSHQSAWTIASHQAGLEKILGS